MTDHPINTVVVDNVAVGKSSVRGYLKDRVRLRVESASEVVSNDYSDAFGLDLNGRIYDRDTGDRTTAHDGVRCLVDSIGTRFKAVTETDIPPQLFIATGATTGRTIADHFGDFISTEDFGTAFDGETDDTEAWIAATDYSASARDTIFPPNGRSLLGEPLLLANGPVSIKGRGAGTGPGVVLEPDGSIIQPTFDEGNVFETRGRHGSVFEHLQFRKASSSVPMTSGAYIYVKGQAIEDGAESNAGAGRPTIRFVEMADAYDGIVIKGAYRPVVSNNQIGQLLRGPSHVGITVDTFSGYESTGGEYRANWVWSKDDAYASYLMRVGYFTAFDNSSLGGQNAFIFNPEHNPAGPGASIRGMYENFSNRGIWAFNTNNQKATQLFIIGNETINRYLAAPEEHIASLQISAGDGVDERWLSGVIINSEIYRAKSTRTTGGPSTTGGGALFAIDGTNALTLGPVIGSAMSGSATEMTGITLGPNNRLMSVLFPLLYNESGLTLMSNMLDGDWSHTRAALLYGPTFAKLPNADNGSFMFVPDGKAGSAPLAGSGAGTFAFKQGGVWLGLGGIYESTAAAVQEIRQGAGNNARISFILDGPTNENTWYINANRSGNRWSFGSEALGDVLSFDNNGRLGIGTISPIRKVHIQDASAATVRQDQPLSVPSTILVGYTDNTFASVLQSWGFGGVGTQDFVISDLGTSTSGTGTARMTVAKTTGDTTFSATVKATAFRVGPNQVLGARDTGWAAMTGTANKATVYDISTVTLEQLASRVAAIQAALTTHGIFGA